MEEGETIAEPKYFLPECADLHTLNVHIEDELTEITVPSRSIPGEKHTVTMDNRTRQLVCDCKGFVYHSYCHHVRALLFFFYKKSKKKGVQDTSIASYYSFTPQDLERSQFEVYNFLREKGPMCNREISVQMPKPINAVTARIKELREMGIVYEYGKKFDSVTNRNVTNWMAVDCVVEV
jgi:hypothetical protein